MRWYGRARGVPQGRIYTFAQDARGIVWAGTEAGLLWFTGRAFEPVKAPQLQTPVRAIIALPDGGLLLGQEDGIRRWRPGRAPEALTIPGLPPGEVRGLAQDWDGRLWIRVRGGEWRYRLDASGAAQPLPGLPSMRQSSSTAFFVHPARPKAYAVGEGGTLYAMARNQSAFHADGTLPLGLGETVLSLAEDGDGHLWALTHRALHRRRPGQDRWEHFPLERGTSALDGSRLLLDGEGWVWCHGMGFLQKHRGDQVVRLGSDPETTYLSAFPEASGVAWFGTFGAIGQLPAYHSWRLFDRTEGLSFGAIWAIQGTPDGRLWLGTDSGLFVHSGSTWKPVVPRTVIRQVEAGPDGTVWAAGAPPATLFRVRPGTTHAEALAVPHLLASSAVDHPLVDAQGTVWVRDNASTVVKGHPLPDGTLRWELWGGPAPTSPRWDYVMARSEDRETLFIARGQRIHAIRGAETLPLEGLLEGRPFRLAPLPDGSVVVAYLDSPQLSQHRLEQGQWRRTGIFRCLEQKGGVKVKDLVADLQGRLYVGGTNALARIDPARGDSAEWLGGYLPDSAPNVEEGALWLDPTRRRLWIGMPNLLARHDLEPPTPPAQPGLHVVSTQVQGEPPVFGLGDLRLEARRPITLSLSSGDSRLAADLHFQTRISGIDRDWQDQEPALFRLSGLAPGRYTLELRTHIPGSLSTPVRALPLYVVAPWYRTAWAWVVYGLGLAAATAGLVHWRTRALQRQRTALERLVAERTRSLEEASEAKSRFLANMSHELRTPLNAVILYSELMKEELAEAGAHQAMEDLDHIQSSGRFLLSLINGILDLAKIEAGKVVLQYEDVDLHLLFLEVQANLSALAAAQSTRLALEVEADLHLQTDRTRLQQILVNLGSNACRFTKEGRVTLSATTRDQGVLFRVEDTGVGMTAEQLQRIFEAFEQATDDTQRRYGGTGLGLTIARRLTELMGGHVRVDSTPGSGSTFSVWIPAQPAASGV